MTRTQIETALREGVPFAVHMADGKTYEVQQEFQLSLGKTVVTIMGEDDMPHVLPLLTMTGISYLKPDDTPQERTG